MLTVSRLLSMDADLPPAADCFAWVVASDGLDEAACLQELLPLADPGVALRAVIADEARTLVEQVRLRAGHGRALEALLREYGLDTREGLLLMCLAEALLRVPDAATADALIRDRLDAAEWERHLGRSDNLLVNFATWGLALTGRVIEPEAGDGRPGPVLGRLLRRSGEPVIRAALGQALKLLGRQFVLGRDIDQALRHAQADRAQGYTHSFDMLGEAALTEADAQRYLADYHRAIERIGHAPAIGDGPRPSVSIKLSALHPRYEAAQHDRALDALFARVLGLGVAARRLHVGLTLDAEEADRLELSLELFERLLRDPALAGWGEFGLVVQAYSRRCLPVLVWLTQLGRELGACIPVRLVKGAYWDSEIKQCQVRGLDDYPVFTRKDATDVSYLAAARYLLCARTQGVLRPQFATHNAHTVASVLALAGDRPFEFQRLHGMGEALYACVRERHGRPVRIYAPVGLHRELLPYLVRRLLENGANASFVHRLADPRVPVATLIEHPVERLHAGATRPGEGLPRPPALYGERRNAQGLNLNSRRQWAMLRAAYEPQLARRWQAAPVIDGQSLPGAVQTVRCPFAPGRAVGEVRFASAEQARQAIGALQAAWPGWNATPVDVRAGILERLADLLERHRPELMALCTLEAGKTLQDGLDEVREAVDFCRYYAAQARLRLRRETLPGPTGERNELFYEGRGVFVCISPWNFPLAIYLGQIVAALVAGNTVLAKPAEQTGLIAARALALLFEAGLPASAIAFLPGDGDALGEVFCRDPRVAGVCFTGATETARTINRRLAERDGPLATLIAETGGQNAMLVDSTALPEQVVRDALSSAFTSAGQRCSALRVLYVQHDIAARVIELLRGAMAELRVGVPSRRETDVGPVIDDAARQRLRAHIEAGRAAGRLLAETPLPEGLEGTFVAPVALEIDGIQQLDREHFGPVLHVARYAADELDAVLAALNATGYGLTLGVHSRNETTIRRIEAQARVGNLYVNRNQIGAVVGVQPFGGSGLSGTGPKAGGPGYLPRFVTERTTTVNTTAVGGNATLLARIDD